MGALFRLPDELVLNTLNQTFPCRELQIRALATLLYVSAVEKGRSRAPESRLTRITLQPDAAPCGNIVIYGTESTGKSAITESLLRNLALAQATKNSPTCELKYAIINSIECITGRHLLESAIAKVADALDWGNPSSRCEGLSQLVVELSKMLLHPSRSSSDRFVLVFDAIDRQREAPPTLLPALARLAETIPNLTTLFIMTSPPAGLMRISSVPHIPFPNYSKSDFVKLLSLDPPPPLATTTQEETTELWNRFTAAVHDTLTRAAIRTLPAFRRACHALWPRFTAPIQSGTHSPREFSKLLVAARVHFQDESLLDPTIISTPSHNRPSSLITSASSAANGRASGGAMPSLTTHLQKSVVRPSDSSLAPSDLANLLPTTARLLLLAAYLASHNAARHDLTLFSTFHHGRRRRRGGLAVGGGRGRGGGARSKHRKIARKLLGAHAFVLERMMAIFAAVRREWDSGAEADDGRRIGSGLDADVGTAIATLASLRLLTRVGGSSTGGDPLDRGGKWRVNVGWEVVRGLGRSMGIEVEEWLID